MQDFSKDVQTFITTHSPHFVPRGAKTGVLIIDKAQSAPFSTTIVGNDYLLARQLLGVSLLDSMYLYPVNIIVEGPSDEILLRGAWEKLSDSGRCKTDPHDIRFFPGGNASGACTLFESLITFGSSTEVALALVVDGDEAGQKALRGLIARTHNALPLKANKDYFELEVNGEWMTASRVMELIEKERPNQVRLTRNTKGEITSFVVLDGHKKAVAKRIIELSTIDDLLGFEKVILQIEKAISTNRPAPNTTLEGIR